VPRQAMTTVGNYNAKALRRWKVSSSAAPEAYQRPAWLGRPAPRQRPRSLRARCACRPLLGPLARHADRRSGGGDRAAHPCVDSWPSVCTRTPAPRAAHLLLGDSEPLTGPSKLQATEARIQESLATAKENAENLAGLEPSLNVLYQVSRISSTARVNCLLLHAL
jgi:hypothetical protein